MNLPDELIEVLGEELAQELDDAVNTCMRECKDPYAQAYLEALQQAYMEHGLHGVAVQLLYAQSNLQYWRGESAKKTKAIFKKAERKLAQY